MERWTWRPKSKRLFMLKLVEKELVNPETVAKKSRPPKTWGDEEIEKLRELYEEHKDSDDVMDNGEQERSQQRSERPQSSGESSDSDSESSDSESNDDDDKDISTRLEISSNRVYDDEKVFDLDVN
ncbi:hypothetical protein Ocin01_04031 [Orchesella cincta]|uniref:Uncharacterized protein n=1 Tax=Orchesella cincta TaxID=48709 RepID=A0A1D2NBL9_ORCCI|nr:hypothetical protein Ocin01_04031 [Orchesella cincta]